MKKHYLPIASVFMKSHRRSGEKTDFFAKLQKYIDVTPNINKFIAAHGEIQATNETKCSTIRETDKINIGDEIVFFTWAGQSYRKAEVEIDGKTESIGRIELGSAICIAKKTVFVNPNDKTVRINGKLVNLTELYKDEGLSEQDFWDWFSAPFTGFQYIFKKKFETHQRDAILYFPVYALVLTKLFANPIVAKEVTNTHLRIEFVKSQLTKAAYAKSNLIIDETREAIDKISDAFLEKTHKNGLVQTFFQIAFEMEYHYQEFRNTLRVKKPEVFKPKDFPCYSADEIFRFKEKFKFAKDENLAYFYNEIKKSCVFS